MKKYILAIDQGTTSTRAILFDNMQNVVKTAQKEVKVYFPEVSWVLQKIDVADVVQVDGGPQLGGQGELLGGGVVGGEHDLISGKAAAVRHHQLGEGGAVGAAALLL